MNYLVEIEQIITVPLVVDTRSEREARALAAEPLLSTAEAGSEAIGVPVVGASRIRSARKLGA